MAKGGSRRANPHNKAHQIGTKLVAWYSTHGRSLPWRQTTDPYAIWVSEIILQQTRIAQGTAYYHRFLARFPTVQALAAAPVDEVLKAWEGLGYYSRARNLHRAAQAVVNNCSGVLPRTHTALMALPGIGPYTARAVAALAFGERVAVVDGNVLRVISRVLADATPINAPAAKTHYQTLADAWLGDNNPADFNSAMMDLGATCCTPRSPLCTSCPLQAGCAAYVRGTVSQFPIKHKARVRPTRYFEFYLVGYEAGQLVVRQRQQAGFWRGLWELPNEELPDFSSTPEIGNLLSSYVQHEFTHFSMRIRIVHLPLRKWKVRENEQVIALNQVPKYAFARAVHKILEVVDGLAVLDGLRNITPPSPTR